MAEQVDRGEAPNGPPHSNPAEQVAAAIGLPVLWIMTITV